MKTREEILRLAQSGEEKLMLAQLMDRLETCRTRNYMTATKFLDMRERALAEDAVRLMGASHECVFTGGYEDAERVCAVFFPDYMTAEDAVSEENSPLCLLRATKSPSDTLAHRDYLGALMGLQIEREMVGDILVHETGADILVLREMKEFILMNFGQAGKRHISLSEAPLSELRRAAVTETEGEGSVASMRLDSVSALIFNLSRTEIQARIAKGTVYLNNRPCLKNEKEIGPGDRITVRGLGRAKIEDLGGVSRKGRQFVRYIKSV